MSNPYAQILPREENVITIVFRDLTKEELEPFMGHDKAIYFGWCHAPHERDAAREALARAIGEQQ